MSSIDLVNKSACLFGLPDSGKSTLANFILTQYGASALVYDTLNEFADTPYDRYVPIDRNDTAELERVTRAVLKSRRYRIFAIDETNRHCPSKPAPLPQAIADLNDFRAHYRLGTIYIARRPVQLNQDLTELAHYLFIFSLTGKNDVDYLNNVAQGLGDTVRTLQPYHFVTVYPDRRYKVTNPVPVGFKTNKLIGVSSNAGQTGNDSGNAGQAQSPELPS